VNPSWKMIADMRSGAKRSSASLTARNDCRAAQRRDGMTLVELLLAVGLMAVVATVAFLGYNAAVRAWQAGTELSNSIHQGDYVMEQIAMGLRSAYWRKPTPGHSSSYGFSMADDGDAATAHGVIRWSKLGAALIGEDAPYAGMPHAVEVAVRDVTDARGKTRTGLTVRSWRLDLQQSDFDPDKVQPVLLSTRVVGLNCRTLDPIQPPPPASGGKPDLHWLDKWENTNQLPRAVEITLFLQPTEDGQDPLEMKRIVRIPLADQSQGK